LAEYGVKENPAPIHIHIKIVTFIIHEEYAIQKNNKTIKQIHTLDAKTISTCSLQFPS
jgi:hypothetical protein